MPKNKDKMGLGDRAREAGQSAKKMAVKARDSISKGAMWFGFYLVAIKDEVRAAIRGYEKDFNNAKDTKSKEAVMQTARANVEERIRVASLSAGTRLSTDQLASVRDSLRHTKTPADLRSFIEQAIPDADTEAKHESDLSKHTSGSSFDVDEPDRFDEQEEDDDSFGRDEHGNRRSLPPTPVERGSIRSSSVRDSINKLNQGNRTSMQAAGVRTSTQSTARTSVQQRTSVQSAKPADVRSSVGPASVQQSTETPAQKWSRITGQPIERYKGNILGTAGVTTSTSEVDKRVSARQSTSARSSVKAQDTTRDRVQRDSVQQARTNVRPESLMPSEKDQKTAVQESAGKLQLNKEEAEAVAKFKRIRPGLTDEQTEEFVKSLRAKAKGNVGVGSAQLKRVEAPVASKAAATVKPATGGMGGMFAEMQGKQLKKATASEGTSPKAKREPTELDKKLAKRRPDQQ